MKRFKSILKYLLYIMPVAFFFSYWPVIQLGGNETMNFELSLPLIWLVVFDVTGFVALCRERKLFEGLKNKWMWLLFPVWLTISVIWSLNATRGILTVGILWLICFAVYAMWSFRNWFDAEFRVKWLKWFLVSALVACLWCMVQCVLDLVGIGQDVSLMCDGCTYRMFGFPHPNGFAIEPQFMGNLLLAPAIVEVGWLMLRLRPRPAGPSPRAAGAKSRAAALRNAASPKHHAILFFMFASTIFLTFSRGAIYAFVVAMIFMTAFMIVKEKKKRSEVAKRIGVAWGIVAFSFLFTLNLQGIMAQVSPTNDTYITGVGKVLNHLSLGVIDIRGERESLLPEEPEADLTKKGNDDVKNEVVENSVENLEDNRGESVFDGYVAESTDTRLKLSGAAVKIWSQDFKTAVFGVGLGGAGQALYNNDLSPAPKEIVQNEYASLLLETGIIGVSLLILTLVLIIRVAIKSSASGLVLTILVAYGVTLCFFSGLPNALQIYLLPMMIYMVFRK